MHRKKQLLIEFTIAAIILAILILTMLPRFFDVQTRTKVAQAQQDLVTIVKAMQTYNRIVGENDVLSVYICKDWKDENNNNIRYSARKSNRSYKGENNRTQELKSVLHEYPIPQLPIETKGNQPNFWGSFYAVEHRDIRFQSIKPVSVFPTESIPAHILYWYTFYKDYYTYKYLGISQGPLIDHRKPNDFQNSRSYCVNYNPSNGIMSHGFLIAAQNQSAIKKSNTKPLGKFDSTPWKPQPKKLAANITATAHPVSVTDSRSLIQLHNSVFQTLDVTYQGTYIDYIIHKKKCSIRQKCITDIDRKRLLGSWMVYQNTMSIDITKVNSNHARIPLKFRIDINIQPKCITPCRSLHILKSPGI
jgi:Tfp pilus assembly protein PilE